MTATAYLTHPSFVRHDPGDGHPECPARLLAIDEYLRSSGLMDRLEVHVAPPATDAQLLRVHSQAHLEALGRKAPLSGIVYLDPDTGMCPHSLDAARHGAGALVQGVDLVLAGTAGNAFCAVRPPGHHAEAQRAQGFCLFNNVAVGAAHALANGISRLAVVDFDVHHGNGTEAIFEHHPAVLVCSVFQHPCYPGTALGRAAPNIVHAPLAPGAKGAALRQAWTELMLPALERHRPELVLVSAGFDGHHSDPLAQWELVEADYAWITVEICALAARHGGGRVVSTLEGGYALPALARSVGAHVEALLDAAARA